MKLDRRHLIAGLGALPLAGCAFSTRAQVPKPETFHPAQTSWPVYTPPTAPGRMVEAAGGQFWVRDSGGDGVAVVLLHPATGSSEIWGYQVPALVAAGYRVISYSRRGFHRSSALDGDAPGSSTKDLHALVEVLGLDRFHLIGSAAGGFMVSDYALAHPERLITMTIASSFAGVVEPEYREALAALKPDGFDGMPASFRELGPSYRAGSPEGVRLWEQLEREATQGRRIRQPVSRPLTWAAIRTIRTPTLILTGDADLYMPPHLMRLLASYYPDCETAVFGEAGHSVYWEQPAAFNRVVLDFMGRRGGA